MGPDRGSLPRCRIHVQAGDLRHDHPVGDISEPASPLRGRWTVDPVIGADCHHVIDADCRWRLSAGSIHVIPRHRAAHLLGLDLIDEIGPSMRSLVSAAPSMGCQPLVNDSLSSCPCPLVHEILGIRPHAKETPAKGAGADSHGHMDQPGSILAASG